MNRNRSAARTSDILSEFCRNARLVSIFKARSFDQAGRATRSLRFDREEEIRRGRVTPRLFQMRNTPDFPALMADAHRVAVHAGQQVMPRSPGLVLTSLEHQQYFRIGSDDKREETSFEQSVISRAILVDG